MHDTSERGFRKRLTLFDATAIVMGSMIGSGIFIVSADIARAVGSPGVLLLAWILTGILTVTAAACYGELACLFPRTGGQYVFLREAYGPLVAFLFGWASFLVIQCGTIAAVAMAFAKFTGVLIPRISDDRLLWHWKFLRLSSVHLAAIASVWLLTWINTRGVTTGKAVQSAFTFQKTLILVALIFVGLFIARNAEAVRLNAAGFWEAGASVRGVFTQLAGLGLASAVGAAMVGSLFSSDAWNNITFASDELIRPKRDLPLSLVFGTLGVCILYVLVNLAYLQALPLRGSPDATSVFGRGMQFAADDRIATAAMQSILGPNAASVMAVAVVISTFGCNNGIILSSARLTYAMAKDGLFFKPAGVLSGKAVPSRGLVIQAVWTSLLCLSGSYSNLLDYVVFTVLLFYVLTIASIAILRKKMPDAPRPYKAFGYPVVPFLYAACILFIMANLLIVKPMYTWPGLIIVLLGVPVFFLWRRMNRAGEVGISS